MCNWCNNILSIKGKKEDLENFKQKYIGKDEEGKKSFLDFDKIIPTTKSEEEAHKEWLKADEKTKKRYRDEKAFWFDQFGVDWRVKHWGIKWNPEINEPHYYKDDLYYSFSTAWADPNGIVRQLIINHPELEFHLEYEEWGELFKGDLKGKNGKVELDEWHNCDCGHCPKCETSDIKIQSEKYFECSDCGNKYTLEESEKYEKENGL